MTGGSVIWWALSANIPTGGHPGGRKAVGGLRRSSEYCPVISGTVFKVPYPEIAR